MAIEERYEFVPALLKARDWDQAEINCIQYYDAMILRDFGIFKEGQVLEWIAFDYDKQIIEAGKLDSNEKLQQCFSLVPCTEPVKKITTL